MQKQFITKLARTIFATTSVADPDPGLNKLHYLNFNFLVHEDTFWSIFSSKKFRGKSLPKIYSGQISGSGTGSTTLATTRKNVGLFMAS
jgi:hypothetical protein